MEVGGGNVRVVLENQGTLGFSLDTDAAGRLVVAAVSPDGPNAAAVAALRPGYELREVDGQSVAGMPMLDVVPLLKTEYRPLTLGFAVPDGLPRTPDRSPGPAIASRPLPSASPAGSVRSAHPVSIPRHTASRQARTPGQKRIGVLRAAVDGALGFSSPEHPGGEQAPPPPPPPSSAAPITGRYAGGGGAARPRTQGSIARLREMFDRCDRSGNGQVSRAEMIHGLRNDPALCAEVGIAPPHGDADRRSFETAFQGMDADDSRTISFDELLSWVGAEVARQSQPSAELSIVVPDTGGLRQRRGHGVSEAFQVPAASDDGPSWLGGVGSSKTPSKDSGESNHGSEPMTIPSSSGWAEERGSGSEDEYGVGDPIDQRMAEYHIIKSHRDSSPVEPTKVTLAMKGETFLSLPDPTPQPTMSAPDLPDRSPPEDSIMERTCFCFGRRNQVRLGCQKLVKTGVFENFIILLIFGNSAVLAWHDPLEPDSEHNKALDTAGKVFTLVFSVEMFIKIIAQGFILDRIIYDPKTLEDLDGPTVLEGAYLRESAWNWLDFIVVVTGWTDFIPGYKNNFGILRTVRVLRPLRAITTIKSMKSLVSTLMDPAVLKKLANVCLLCGFVFIVFAIIAVNMFSGVLRSRCFSETTFEEHEDEGICAIDLESSGRRCDDGYFCSRINPVTGEDNSNPAYGYVSFDTFIDANFTIFVMMTLEGWTEVMYMTMDGYGSIAWIYFVTLICMGVFVVINLFLAVISMGYEEQCEKAHEEMKLNKEAKDYLHLLCSEIPKALAMPPNADEEAFLLSPYAKTERWASKIDVHYPEVPPDVMQLRKDSLVAVFSKNSEDTMDSPVDLDTFRAGLLKFMVSLDAKQDSFYQSGNVDVVQELKRTTAYFNKQWKQFDDDESGTLDFDEVKGVFLASKMKCDEQQMRVMWDQMDEDGSGEIDLQEFVSWWVNRAHEYGLSIEKEDKPYGVPIILGDGRIRKLLFVLTNPDARGSDFEFRKDMTLRMYECMLEDHAADDGKLSAAEVIEVLGTPPVNPEDLKPKPVEKVKLTKVALRGKNCWEVTRLVTLYTVEQAWFNNIVTAIVLLNCVALAVDYHGISQDTMDTLDIINLGCTIAFGVEMFLKLLGMGPRRYLSDSFNIFDGSLVLLSLVELAMPNADSGISVLRALRIFRIMKLSSSLESFKRVIVTILSVLPDLGNFGGLMGLFMFFFATMGLHLFGVRNPEICSGGLDTCVVPDGYEGDPEGLLESDGEVARVNFHDFGTSLVTVFQILTGEDWNAAMYSCMNTYGEVSVIYFLTLTIIGTYCLLNLFLAVLILKTMEAFSPTVDPLARVLARYKRQFNPLEEVELTSTLEKIELDGRSLYLFGKHSAFRKSLRDIVNDPNFDNFILLCIVISSVALAVEEPGQNAEVLEIIAMMDLFFTVVFTMECLLKILCQGLLCESDHTYLKNSWNVLDFLIVVAGLVDMAMTQQAVGVCANPAGGTFLMVEGFNSTTLACEVAGGIYTKESEIKWVRTFRVLRALRPLRVIKRVPELKQVVNSLFQSIPTLANVLMVLVIFWLIFGILGVQLFKGQFYTCSDGDVVSINDCIGVMVDADSGELVERAWSNTNYGFDNIGQSVVTLFEVSTLEMWLDIMYSSMDSTGDGRSPVENAGPFYPIFYLIFIVFGSFFLLQLFAGAIVNEYNQLNEQAGGCAFQSARQKRIVNKLVLKHKSDLVEPRTGWQKRIVNVTKDPRFRNFISLSIVLNVVVMAMAFYDMSQDYENALDTLNDIFTFVFAGEAVIKLVGLGTNYFKKGWNRFDLFVVLVTLFEFLYARIQTDGDLSFLQLLRTFRILRLFKLFSRMEDLMALFLAVVNALPTMINVGGLLGLIFFIYAVLGMHLMGNIVPADDAEFLDDHTNFNSFGTSLLTVFRMATGESWNGIMHDCMVQPPDCDAEADECGSPAMALIYFVSFQLIGQFIMLNLFIAVVLEHYKKATDQTEPVLTEEDFRSYEGTWNNICGSDPRNGGKPYKIMPVELFDELMSALPQHIGWSPFERDFRKGTLRKLQALRGPALGALPTRALTVLVPRWSPNATRTVWPPRRLHHEESEEEEEDAVLDLPSPGSQANSVTSTSQFEFHYYHFSEVWHTLFSRAETVAMLDPSNEEMTENQKERRLKQFQSIMASAKAEIARDVSVSIENYGQLEIVRRPVYTETGRLVGADGSGSPRSDGDAAPLGLEPAGPSSTSESVKPLGGGRLPGDTQGTGQMCSPAENFASVFIQRALRRASEPQRRRLRAFATRSPFPLSHVADCVSGPRASQDRTTAGRIRHRCAYTSNDRRTTCE